MKRLLLALIPFALLGSGSAFAVEIKGVTVPDTARVESVDRELRLNGAGVRKKFFFSIYIGALYLVGKSDNAGEIIESEQPKRVAMHFLYDKVEAEKLREAWNEGFQANTTPEEFATLKERLDRFNTYFGDAVKGDVIYLDYLPGTGTRVSVNGEVKGTIPGADFHRALLKVWLGKEPVTSSLKAAMLGK
ncbi:MAG: chalcone isomerase family protein [Gammaproteobacteria bacterium]